MCHRLTITQIETIIKKLNLLLESFQRDLGSLLILVRLTFFLFKTIYLELLFLAIVLEVPYLLLPCWQYWRVLVLDILNQVLEGENFILNLVFDYKELLVKFLGGVFVHFFNLGHNIVIYLGVNWFEIVFYLGFVKYFTNLQLILYIFEFRLMRVNLPQLSIGILNFHLLCLDINLKFQTSFVELWFFFNHRHFSLLVIKLLNFDHVYGIVFSRRHRCVW